MDILPHLKNRAKYVDNQRTTKSMLHIIVDEDDALPNFSVC